MAAQDLPHASFIERYRNAVLGGFAVVLFFVAWQALFLIVPFNPLFITKPSLIAARARGEAPTDRKPGQGTVSPTAPQLGPRPKPPGKEGPNPWLVVGAALVTGVFIAKWIDWRGHAHPRR